MGCYLVCHFSGLWASLMSTLIPLRSGADVYATLGGKKKNTIYIYNLELQIIFAVQDFAFWPLVTSSAVLPHQDPTTTLGVQPCIFHQWGVWIKVDLQGTCWSWLLTVDLSGRQCFMLLLAAVKQRAPDESSPLSFSRNFITALKQLFGTTELLFYFSRIGFDTEQLCCARHHSNTLQVAASVFRHGLQVITLHAKHPEFYRATSQSGIS